MKKRQQKAARSREKQSKPDDKTATRIVAFYRRHFKTANAAILLFIFAACFFVRLNCIVHKTELHSDEVFSMMLSTCNSYYNHALPDGDYSGEELKRLAVLSGEDGLRGAVADIAQLWRNNGDAPHASLYYMVLRMALIGYDSFDVHEYAMRGGILNLLFFSLSFFFFYKLLRRIFGDRMLLVYAGLAVAFCNVLSIRNTMLVREYQMAETAVIALTWAAVGLVCRLREGKNVPWRRVVALLAVLSGCVVSLGYFNAIYVIALGIALMAACVRYGYGAKGIGMVVLAGVAGVLFAWMLYAGFFNFLFHETVHKAKAFHNFAGSLSIVFGRDLPRLMYLSYCYWILIAVALVALCSKNGLKSLLSSRYFVWLPIIVLVCMPLIQYASVLKHPRYYYSLLPVLSLIVPQCLSAMSVLWRRYFGLLILLFFPTVTARLQLREQYGWGNLSHELSQPATFYKLNPNELAQLLPVLSDDVRYGVANDSQLEDLMRLGEKRRVVSKPGKWSAGDFEYTGHVVWNRNIYLYDIEYVGNRE